MSRSTAKKAMTNENKSNRNASLFVSARNGQRVRDNTKDAKSERSFQTRLEAMQLEIRSGKFDVSELDKRSNKQIKRFNDTYQKLKDILAKEKKGEKPVSEYKTLRGLYDRDLAHLTLDSFATAGEVQAGRLIAKSRAENLTDAQKNLIIEYFDKKAAAQFRIVSEVRNLLVERGEIKETKETTATETTPVTEIVE